MFKFLIFVAISALGVQCERGGLEAAIAEYRAEKRIEVNPCVGMENNIFMSNPRGCSWFYTCFNDEAIPNRCPGDLYFNEQEQNCDFPDSVECEIDDGRSASCPRLGIGLLPHPYSCEKYTVCFNEIEEDRECQIGLHFSYFDRDCIDPFLADCRVSESVCVGGIAGQPIFVPNSRDCESFFICVGSEIIGLRCEPGSQFDRENNWCTTNLEQANCTSSLPDDRPPIPEKIFFDCPGNNDFLEFHAHPELCEFYFACIGGSSYLQICAENLIFDARTLKCNTPNVSVCDSSKESITEYLATEEEVDEAE